MRKKASRQEQLANYHNKKIKIPKNLLGNALKILLVGQNKQCHSI